MTQNQVAVKSQKNPWGLWEVRKSQQKYRSSKVPMAPWVAEEDTRKMTAEIDSVTEAIAREREEKLEATTAILGTQQQTTSKLAEVTFSMATLLEGLVADVQEMKKTFSQASRPMDSGCYPSPSLPVGGSSKYDQQGARPKQQLTTQNPGPIARPVRPPPGLEFDTEIESPIPGIHNASTEVQIGSPSHGTGYRPAGEVNLPRESTPNYQVQQPDLRQNRPSIPNRPFTPAPLPVPPRVNQGARMAWGEEFEDHFPTPVRPLADRDRHVSFPDPPTPVSVPPTRGNIGNQYPMSTNQGYHYGDGGPLDCAPPAADQYWRPIQDPRRRPYVGYSTSGRPKMLPCRYDGKGSWEDYLIQFETIAGVNGWNPQDRAHFLVASLDGDARNSLTNLCQQGALGNYEAIIAALSQDFGNQHRTPLYRAEMKSRRRKEGESIADLARAFRKLAGLAYPELTFHLQETLALENFLEALDYETALAVYQAQCATLSEAAKVATELEAFRLAERRKHQPRKFARMVKANEDVDVHDDETEESLKELLKEVKQMLKRRQPIRAGEDRGAPQPQRARNSGMRPNQGQRDLSTVECWNCGQYGHYRTNCPEPVRERRQGRFPMNSSSQQGNC